MNNDKRLSRQELLQWINAVSFAVNDVTLFLDTHPDDAEALEYFEEFRTQRTRALQEYSRNYGPVSYTHLIRRRIPDHAGVICDRFRRLFWKRSWEQRTEDNHSGSAE